MSTSLFGFTLSGVVLLKLWFPSVHDWQMVVVFVSVFLYCASGSWIPMGKCYLLITGSWTVGFWWLSAMVKIRDALLNNCLVVLAVKVLVINMYLVIRRGWGLRDIQWYKMLGTPLVTIFHNKNFVKQFWIHDCSFLFFFFFFFCGKNSIVFKCIYLYVCACV